MRFTEDYSGTIKSSTHRRQTSGLPIAGCTANKVPSTFELENSKTKYKLDQLRQVMQEKKARREARKLKNLPYHTNRNVESIIEEVETVA